MVGVASYRQGDCIVIRLNLSELQALHLLAALEAWQESQPLEALEAPIGRLTATGVAAPYRSALEALEARQ